MRKLMNKKVTAITMITVLAASLVSGCGSTASTGTSTAENSTTEASTDPIYIGTSFPMTGSIAADGLTCLNAVQLAVEEVNAAGGVNGRMIELVSEDDEGSPTSAAAIANKFADNKDIVGAISSYNSSCMLAQVNIYKDASLPSISPVATTPALTGISDYFYRTAPNDADVGAEGATFCQDLGWNNVALLYENDDYGLGIAEQFENKCKEIGINIATVQTFVYGETVDYSTILTAVAEANVDGMFIGGCVTEAGLICQQKGDYGCGDIGIIGANGLYAPAILDNGDAVEGLYVLGEYSSDMSDTAAAFAKAYKEKYDIEPGNFAALSYDAAMVMVNALKSIDGEITRESLNEAIASSSYEGVAGTYTFKDCNCQKSEMRFQVVDNKFTIFK